MSRINIKELEPNSYKAMLGLEQYIRNSQIDPKLRELIKIRASQINGCAYCIDMHTQEALKIGESQRRIFALSAWKESPLFTEEERAVLQLTEEVTLISKDGVSDETYSGVLKLFGENVLAQIIMQIIVINSWNRIAVATRQIFEG
ncbi:MAG TPA: carboxymuconolactone decarboxylase family protein [Hanamia sp.]|nr:carboxymuconolactone decarboxylase family protein [Hanamia sp.]